MPNKDLIEALNVQFNREVTTALRYMLQAAEIKGAEWEAVRSMYLAEVPSEVAHAQYLANQIVLLGGTPKLEPDLPPTIRDPREMLKGDAEQERVDAKTYAALAAMAEKDRCSELKLKLEELAADEDRHSQQMIRLRG